MSAVVARASSGCTCMRGIGTREATAEPAASLSVRMATSHVIAAAVAVGAVWTRNADADACAPTTLTGRISIAIASDHIGARAGALRGIVAGSVFGAFILIAHEIHGEDAKAHLPEPAIVLVAITTGLAVPLAGLGGWLRQRQERKARVREAPSTPTPG